MKNGRAAVKKATCTSVKGSEKSLDNLLKHLALSFSSSDKNIDFKATNLLFHDCNIVQEKESHRVETYRVISSHFSQPENSV